MSGSPRIRETLLASRNAGRKAFVPYITAGDPSLTATKNFMRALADDGASVIELGVPFSDPIADGPVNQRSADRALKAGTTLSKIFEMLAEARAEGFSTPVVLFTYLNPMLALGLETFASRAKSAGADGVLVVDLPFEESADVNAILAAAGLESVMLASPTTAADRLAKISAAATGFLYYVSRFGVTGEQSELSATLAAELGRVREVAGEVPVAVGFGISTPEQAAQVAAHADAIVVGSALVKFLDNADESAAIRDLGGLAGAIVRAINHPHATKK